MKLLSAILVSAAAMLAQNAGVIAGAVRSSATHAPLEDAQVSLSGAGVTGAQTDARGSFHFSGLPRGKYTLRIEKPGYRRSAPVEIQADAEPVTVDLDPLAQIEGRILDEDGNPAIGVTAEWIFPPFDRGDPLKDPATEKSGHFLLSGLEPGDYWIRLRIPAALRAEGYPAAEFYPGVTDSARATPIRLADGQQMTGLNIRLRRVPLVAFRGRVVDLGKEEAARPVEVALDCEPGPIEGSFARRPLDAGGRFRFDGVPPGRHRLLVYRGTGSDDLPYAATVDVAEEEATVTVPPFATLAGVVKSTAQAPWEGVLGIGISTQGAWRRNVVPDDDGAFTIPDVPPGDWMLRVQSNNLQAAGRALQLASVKFGGVNLNAGKITVSEGGNPPIVITLSDEVGGIAGTVEEGDSKDEALVVAQPLDGRSMGDIRFAEARPDGSFAIAGLLPGEYQVTAWGLAFLRKSGYGADCTSRVTRVSVVNGQTTAVKLKRCGQ